MKRGLVVVTILLLSSVPALTVNPGFRTAFTSKGLDYGELHARYPQLSHRYITLPYLWLNHWARPVTDRSTVSVECESAGY